jgi:hypothetical protein
MQNRDDSVLADYRSFPAGIFKRRYSLDAGRLSSIFPNAVPSGLGLM